MPDTILSLKIGETILIFFILAFAFLIPLIVIGIIIFQLRRRKKVQGAFQQIAQTFGLTIPNPKISQIKGQYNSCEIELAVGHRSTGTGEDRSIEYFTYCKAYFPHSLRFLLDISCPQGFFDRIANSRDIKLGNPAFDNKFTLKCYDPKIVQRLLLSDFPSDSTRNLMGDLIRASNKITYIDITDHEVYTETSGQVSDPAHLRQMLDVTTSLANRFRAAREKFPLADWEKQMFYTWENFAGENNFSFDKKSVKMQGVYQGFPVLIELDTKKGRWKTNVKLKFPRSLMAGLKIMPENSIHKVLSWIGVQDIEIGIKSFDDAFIIKGKNVQMVKHKLRPEFCNQLTALSRKTSDLLIDDHSISLSFNMILGDEKTLRGYLGGVVSIARSLTIDHLH
jgi:hypothetical protein